MRKYIAIIIASLALFTGQAHAQRCLPKMQGIEVRADMADGFNLGGKDGGYSFGAALSTYTKKGNKWVFGGEYLLKGIYTHNGLLYFHTEIKNQSNVPFDVDYITWKIVDKKVAKRTAVQEQIILPLRAQNYATLVPGKKSERTVFTMAKFTIPDDKCLVVELNEKNGGRHQSFVIENEDLVRASTINELQVR